MEQKDLKRSGERDKLTKNDFTLFYYFSFIEGLQYDSVSFTYL